MDKVSSSGVQASNQNEQYVLRANLKYNEKTDSRIRAIFEDIDLNKDKVISQGEIDAYKQYLQLKETNDKKREALCSVKTKANLPWTLGIGAGLIGGMAGAVGSHSILKKIGGKALFKENIVEHFATGDSKNYFKGDYLYSSVEYISTPLKKALTWGGAIVATGLIGYGIYKLISKSSRVNEAKKEVAKRETEIALENAQIEKLDKQYENVNAAIKKAKAQGNSDLSSEEALEALFFTNILFMMADDDAKRKQKDEEDYEDYYKANMEHSLNKPYEN